MPLLYVCVIYYVVLHVIHASQQCTSYTSCSECITSSSSCAWCSTVVSARCLSIHDGGCDVKDTISPHNVVEENTLTLDDVNQVSLESVHLKLRVGEMQNVTFSVKPAENFPLDVYMIMDLSNSLRDVLTTVQTVASQIADSLSNVSSDFRVGFGSYVDKVVPPYTGRAAAEVFFTVSGQPSSCEAFLVCAKPIAFEHNVNLTNVTDDFTSPIQSVRISTNADSPEGTLDAMLQAVVCGDVIGWRETSRKILLVITDATIHTAGDGRQAGILEPNDGQCHTEYDPTENKVLYDGTIQDYPSLYQLRNILREFGVIPIFAVPQSHGTTSPKVTAFLRDHIAPLLEGFVEELTEDADNIVDVLQETLDSDAVSKVRLAYKTPEYLSISVYAECPTHTNASIPGECDNIGSGTVNFTLSLMLNSCDELGNDIKDFEIKVTGFDSFVVHVRGHCSCECEEEVEYNSTVCSNNGHFSCGLCECEEGWSGNQCSCPTTNCPVGPNQLECSGRGDCVCGECVCNVMDGPMFGVDNPLITGDACECSNFECEQDSNGVVCSGRGTCMCSDSVYRCDCDTSDITGEQHTGGACQCSTDHCIDPTNMDNGVCSGRGNCSTCYPDKKACTCYETFQGSYCEISVYTMGHCSVQHYQCIYCIAESLPCDTVCNKFYIVAASDDESIPESLDDTTVVCSITYNDCEYTYYSGMSSSNGGIVYVVEPRGVCRSSSAGEKSLQLVLYSLLCEFIIFMILLLVIILLRIKRSKQLTQSEIPLRENAAYALATLSNTFDDHYEVIDGGGSSSVNGDDVIYEIPSSCNETPQSNSSYDILSPQNMILGELHPHDTSHCHDDTPHCHGDMPLCSIDNHQQPSQQHIVSDEDDYIIISH